MNILVTGVAGFVGYHAAKKLLDLGHRVAGIDNLSPYYDVSLKRARLRNFQSNSEFAFRKIDIVDSKALQDVFESERPRAVIHLAAQAGVRHSIEKPEAYVASNLIGFANILESCRAYKVSHLVYASTSSVYGANTAVPFSEHQATDHPVSFYAATKKANEVMAHSYAHLYRLPCTGLRFFTVYGPWGRPDMALFKFTEAILSERPIQVFNNGKMIRDFTYVDDIVEGIVKVLDQPAEPNPNWNGKVPDPATSSAPYRIYNLGNSKPINLMHYIEVLENCLDRKAIVEFRPMQPGDVPETYADTAELAKAVGYRPNTSIEIGVKRFVDWYLEYTDKKS